jgi:oligosaccharide repeat unit polymerase
MLYFSDELPIPSINLFYCISIGIIFFVLGIMAPNLLKIINTNININPNINTNTNTNNEDNIDNDDNNANKDNKNRDNKDNRNNKDNKDKKNNREIKPKKPKRGLESISIFSKYSKLEIILTLFVLVGIVLQIANFINLGGIPLFSGILKASAATKIWLISFITFIIGINCLLAKFNRKSHYILLIIGLGLFALTGYRTTPIAILLSVFITLYYTRNIKLKYQILLVALIAIFLIIVGFIAIQAIEWQQWRLNPLELISYRAGFTLNILDKATYLSGSTSGSLFYYTLTGFFESVDPRVLVGDVVLGNPHSITSTIFGPAILDFGWIAMAIQMFLIGFILKFIHFVQKYIKGIATAFYGIILAQTIIWIETGPTDLVVWIFYLIGIAIAIYYFYFYKPSKNLKFSKFAEYKSKGSE